MIIQIGSSSFTQEINGQTTQISYDQLKVKNGMIHLPLFNGAIEVLILNDAEDDYSTMVARIFAKVAALK